MCCLVECFVCSLFIVYRFLDCEYALSLERNLFSVKFHKSSTRRNFSFIGKKQKFRRRETKVSSRWNKSFSSVEQMKLLRDIIFVLWRTLLAEKVDTFERHIHKKGCLEYCLFMYSVAFFHSEIRKSPPLKSHRYSKNRSRSVTPLQKGQKICSTTCLSYRHLSKRSKKTSKKVVEKFGV